jgi:hypothetical protein
MREASTRRWLDHSHKNAHGDLSALREKEEKMKNLSKDEKAQKLSLHELLTSASSDVQLAVAEVNALIEAKLKPAIEAYNNILDDMESFRDEIKGQMDDYFGERSDKWQEGDAGTAYQAWITEWENFDVSHLDEIEPIQEPEMAHVEAFDNLPEALENN